MSEIGKRHAGFVPILRTFASRHGSRPLARKSRASRRLGGSVSLRNALALAFAAISLAALAGPSAPAFAAGCSSATSTAAIATCRDAVLVRADASVARALAAALAALPNDQRAKLRASQRRWTAFRTADCGVFFGRTTGTIAQLESLECLTRRAKARVTDLAALHDEGR